MPLGVLGQQVWSRAHNPNRDKEAHKAKPITKKESFKWVAGLLHLPELAKRVVTVCDREADIYDLFQEAHNQDIDFIVRAMRNRRVEDALLLRDQLGEISPAAQYTLTVQRQQNQTERLATVELRYTTVTLRPPKQTRRSHLI